MSKKKKEEPIEKDITGENLNRVPVNILCSTFSKSLGNSFLPLIRFLCTVSTNVSTNIRKMFLKIWKKVSVKTHYIVKSGILIIINGSKILYKHFNSSN